MLQWIFAAVVTLLYVAVDLVDIHVIRSVFERHGYVARTAATFVDGTALYSLLVDVFTMCRKCSVSSVISHLNTDTAAELLLNLLLNLYDVSVSLLSFHIIYRPNVPSTISHSCIYTELCNNVTTR